MLRDYALLADGERGALDRSPRRPGLDVRATWDSDGVFSSLIGGRGVYAVTPASSRYVWGGYYEDGSLIWHSRWITNTGVIECREALAFPADPHAAVILRRVMAVSGAATVRVVLDPRAGFGRCAMEEFHIKAECGPPAPGHCICAGPPARACAEGETGA